MAAMAQIVDEIEKALGGTGDENERGQQIGKALKCLKLLEDLNCLKVLAENADEIKKGLSANVSPEDASSVAKLFYSLKKFSEEKDAERAVDSLGKAYIEYAKNTANAYAALFSAINIFGTSISYVIGGNNDYKRLKDNTGIHAVLTALTLGFLPLSLLTVGMTHALTHKPQWKGKVAYMLMAQVLYMVVMCALFGVYLMPKTAPAWAAGCTLCVACILLIFVPWCIFKTPNDLWSKFKTCCSQIPEIFGGQCQS